MARNLPIIETATRIVINVAYLEDGADWRPQEGTELGPEGGTIGDTWDGTQYIKPQVREPEKKPVPEQVTNFQIRAALIGAGLFDTVNKSILARDAADIGRQGWEYGNTFVRKSPFVKALTEQLAAAQGIPVDSAEAQVDMLFLAAAQIEG